MCRWRAGGSRRLARIFRPTQPVIRTPNPLDAHHRKKLKGKTSRDERRLLPALPQRYSSLWAQAMDTEFDAAMDSYPKQEELLKMGNKLLGCLPLGRKTRIGQNAIWRTFAPLLRRIFLLLQ